MPLLLSRLNPLFDGVASLLLRGNRLLTFGWPSILKPLADTFSLRPLLTSFILHLGRSIAPLLRYCFLTNAALLSPLLLVLLALKLLHLASSRLVTPRCLCAQLCYLLITFLVHAGWYASLIRS